MSQASEKIKLQVLENYFARTEKSRKLDEQARLYLPGGDTRSPVYFSPYPAYMNRGEGCRLYDEDGNQYLDFLGNYSSLIHGHAHPRLIRAAQREMERGTIFGAPAEVQLLHARHICNRVPGLEAVRYCNSGTEATMFALRAARAFTGRDLILKMHGGYHGSHDVAEVNLPADTKAQQPPKACVSSGVPACTAEGVLLAQFNDLARVEDLLTQNKNQIAAVIVEPMMGASGLLAPQPGYLHGLSELTRNHGVLLIFDEIITFRLHWGGMQTREEVIPDLTTLGKVVGGGFPVGLFGGRKDVMDVFNPDRPDSVAHGGTFNGNNVTLAAGLASLEMYDQEAVDRLNGLGDRLRQGFRQGFQEAGIWGQVTGLGSLLSVHWGDKEPLNAAESREGARRYKELFKLLHLQLVNQGIHSAPRGMYVASTPMGEAEVDQAIAAFSNTLLLLKSMIEENWPSLIKDH